MKNQKLLMNKEKKLPITEISVVIQGEGQSIGVPMILIRMGGCSLNCQFHDSICDSAETSWSFNAKNDSKYSLSDIESVINENPLIKTVMITGGNPSF